MRIGDWGRGPNAAEPEKNYRCLQTEEPRLLHTTLARVDFFSDGGPKHHKNAESMLATVHLQEWLRLEAIAGIHHTTAAHKAALMAMIEVHWHMMQGNHGKGPYDAEGGILKFMVMRAVRSGDFTFLTGRDVYDWAV